MSSQEHGVRGGDCATGHARWVDGSPPAGPRLLSGRRRGGDIHSDSRASVLQVAAAAALNKTLRETDDELFDIIEKEKRRQRSTLALIASEVWQQA